MQPNNFAPCLFHDMVMPNVEGFFQLFKGIFPHFNRNHLQVCEIFFAHFAEGEGFEPPGPSRARLFSRQVPSTARPTLQYLPAATRIQGVLVCNPQVWLISVSRYLCAWQDSNLHALRHQILSLARLPNFATGAITALCLCRRWDSNPHRVSPT